MLRTHCKHGHDLAVVGTYTLKNGKGRPYRRCRKCRCAEDARRKKQRSWGRKAVPPEVLDEAVAAYQAGESALSIESRLNIPNQTLYWHLNRLDIGRHRPRRDIENLPQYHCARRECNAPLPRGSNMKFCCRLCYRLWLAESARRNRAAA